MILDQIQTARHRYMEENGKSPVEIVMDEHTADLLRIACNKSMAKGQRLEKPEQMFGGLIFGMTIKRWPRNEKGFAVR